MGSKSSDRAAAVGWRRHIDGWPLAGISIAVGLIAVWLVSPRPTTPDVLPLPEVGKAEADRWFALEHARSLQAHRQQLPRQIRAIGESYREYSLGTTLDRPSSEELTRFRQRVALALQQGHASEVAQLRATQTELFVEAMREWRRTGRQEQELNELAGTFLSAASKNGWLDSLKQPLTDAALAVLFAMRWSHLAGLLDHQELQPPVVLWQLYFDFLLRHPEEALSAPMKKLQHQLGYVESLSRHDPHYPRDFALGVLQYRAYRYVEAEQSFRRFLANPANQRWRLRARNHWLECRSRIETFGTE